MIFDVIIWSISYAHNTVLEWSSVRLLWQFGVVFLMFEETKFPLHMNAVTDYYVIIYKCPGSYNFMAWEVSTLPCPTHGKQSISSFLCVTDM